ncbi:MAG: hypothetical protein ACOYUZ_01130 [Patescibacteria group bacterium]
MKKLVTALATLVLTASSGCASSGLRSQVELLAIGQRGHTEELIKLRDKAQEQEHAIERVRTKAANLETEAKRLRKVLCEKHPEDCPASVLK